MLIYKNMLRDLDKKEPNKKGTRIRVPFLLKS